jgi:hypothetical protein
MAPSRMSLQAATMAEPIESNFTGATRRRSGIFPDGVGTFVLNSEYVTAAPP